jgi:hypothetical protein
MWLLGCDALSMLDAAADLAKKATASRRLMTPTKMGLFDGRS